MTTIYDKTGKVVKRIVRTQETVNAVTVITQVPTTDGGWWNIQVERIGKEQQG